MEKDKDKSKDKPKVKASEDKYDAFTDSVIRRIDPDVMASLTHDQREAIVEAVSSSRPLNRHPIDFRGIAPLFFANYYYVFLMGRDKRYGTQTKEATRRQGTALAGGAVFFLFAISPILVLALIVLYLLKSFAGIDLVQGEHAWEFLGNFLK